MMIVWSVILISIINKISESDFGVNMTEPISNTAAKFTTYLPKSKPNGGLDSFSHLPNVGIKVMIHFLPDPEIHY